MIRFSGEEGCICDGNSILQAMHFRIALGLCKSDRNNNLNGSLLCHFSVNTFGFPKSAVQSGLGQDIQSVLTPLLRLPLRHCDLQPKRKQLEPVESSTAQEPGTLLVGDSMGSPWVKLEATSWKLITHSLPMEGRVTWSQQFHLSVFSYLRIIAD